MKDKISEGYDSLLRLGIHNCAEVIGGDTLCRETGVLYGKDTKPKYLVKEVGLRHSPFVFVSMSCSPIVDGKILCNNCMLLEMNLQKILFRRAEFKTPNKVICRSTNHCYILSTPTVASAYLQSETERINRLIQQTCYYKQYNQRLLEQGVNLSMISTSDLFGEDILLDGLEDRFVLIGGKIPHWVKRVVNGLENSSNPAHTQNLMLNGCPLGLGIMSKAWEAV